MMVGRGRSGFSRSPTAASGDGDKALHIAVTCLDDGHTHAVADVELTNGAARSGRYPAVCGHVVTAAPMVAPEGSPCPDCRAAASAPARGPRHAQGGGPA